MDLELSARICMSTFEKLTKTKSIRGSEGSCKSVKPNAPFEPSGDWELLDRAGDVARLRLWSLPRNLLGDG